MQTIITIGILGLSMAGLALGLFFKREPIKGHCGGGTRMTVDGKILACDTCGGDSDKCENRTDGDTR